MKNLKRIPVLFVSGILVLGLVAFSTESREKIGTDNCFSGQDIQTLVSVGNSIHAKMLAGEEVSDRTIQCWMSATQEYCASHDPSREKDREARGTLEDQYDMMMNALLRNQNTSSSGRNAGLLLPTF